MTFRVLILSLTGIFTFLFVVGCTSDESKSITAFCGSASKPAMEEAAQAFEEETGIRVFLNFGGSGTMLSQMEISQSGDLYIPGSPDYMEMAIEDRVVEVESVKLISYLVPAILVPEGNPARIQGLLDLAGPDIEIGLANPEVVSIGLYAVELLEYNDLLADVAPNVITLTESFSKLASLVSLNSIDTAVGWAVSSEWYDTIDVIYLEPQQVPRLSYISGAISTFSDARDSAGRFLDFLVSPRGQEIFTRWGYISTEDEARKFAPDAEVGGEYHLPENYRLLTQ